MNEQNSALNPSHDDLEPQLEAAVWAVLSEPLPTNAIARVKSRALKLDDEPKQDVRTASRIAYWSRPWMQVASLAACTLLVVGATMMWPVSPSAFAQAIERLKNAGAFRYKEMVYLETQEKPVEVDILVADDGRERRSTLGIVSIRDSNGLLRLSLNEANKSAIVHQPMAAAPGVPERPINWLEQLKAHGHKPDKELGAMKIDRRDCRGFEVRVNESAVFTVWLDAKTNDMVQVEFTGMPKGSSIIKSVMKDFEFNISLDPMLFSLDPPAGYETTTTAKLPEMLPLEESLVETLKSYTELNDGKFPKSISDWGEWAVLMAEKDVEKDKMMAVLGRVGKLLPQLTGMSKADYDYTGAGKSVNEKRSIVFWYRNAEKQLRAVFSDLTVSAITEADLNSK